MAAGGFGETIPRPAAALLQRFMRFRREAPPADGLLGLFLAITSVLIAFQDTVSPTFAFLALIAGGVALGLVGRRIGDTLVGGLFMGWIAFAIGTFAFVLGMAVRAGYSIERITGEAIIGAVSGAALGVIAGLWASGAAALALFLRRRLHVGHVP